MYGIVFLVCMIIAVLIVAPCIHLINAFSPEKWRAEENPQNYGFVVIALATGIQTFLTFALLPAVFWLSGIEIDDPNLLNAMKAGPVLLTFLFCMLGYFNPVGLNDRRKIDSRKAAALEVARTRLQKAAIEQAKKDREAEILKYQMQLSKGQHSPRPLISQFIMKISVSLAVAAFSALVTFMVGGNVEITLASAGLGGLSAALVLVIKGA